MLQAFDDHRANRLLYALEPEDFAYLKPHLEIVTLRGRQVLCEAGDALHHAYFPHDTVVSLLAVMENGSSVEVSLCGAEGVVGLVKGSVSRQSFGRYVVQFSGTASRISLDRMQEAINSRPGIRELMQRFTEVAMTRVLQNAACNAVHDVGTRCCRWILIIHDRLCRDTLPLTHEFLAEMLGVQRSTVTIAMRTLQTAGLIRQERGGITVIDRAGLEKAACECYGTVRRTFERLLPHTFTGAAPKPCSAPGR